MRELGKAITRVRERFAWWLMGFAYRVMDVNEGAGIRLYMFASRLYDGKRADV